MKLFSTAKDGGPDSTVTGYWLCEFKNLFSVVLLKFEGKSREAYHEHAFSAYSWILKGKLIEHVWGHQNDNILTPALRPIYTAKDCWHKVDSDGTTWVVSFRGPWSATWREYDIKERTIKQLSNGRKEVSRQSYYHIKE